MSSYWRLRRRWSPDELGQDVKCRKWAVIDHKWGVLVSPDERAAWQLSAKNSSIVELGLAWPLTPTSPPTHMAQACMPIYASAFTFTQGFVWHCVSDIFHLSALAVFSVWLFLFLTIHCYFYFEPPVNLDQNTWKAGALMENRFLNLKSAAAWTIAWASLFMLLPRSPEKVPEVTTLLLRSCQ